MSDTSRSTSSASGSVDTDCPITAEQVGTLFRLSMQSSATDRCSFERTDGELFPNASYNKQFDVVFDDPSQEGYTDKLDGVGDQAFIKAQADGVWILAKSAGHTFEVRVDSANMTADRDSVKKLAQLVIDTFKGG